MNVKMAAVRISLMLCVGLFVAGCTGGTVIIPSEYDIRKPAAFTKIPLIVGLSTPNDFRKIVFLANRDRMPVVISLGDAMFSGSERALRDMFQEVVLLDNSDANKGTKHVDVVMMPEILDRQTILTGNFAHTWESSITCKWTIKRPDGKVLYMNTIVGKSHFEVSASPSAYRDRVSKSMFLAIQDHYVKLTEDLLSVKWWE